MLRGAVVGCRVEVFVLAGVIECDFVLVGVGEVQSLKESLDMPFESFPKFI